MERGGTISTKYLNSIIKKNRHTRYKKQITKATNFQKLYWETKTNLETQLEKANQALEDWQRWADEYKEAAKHSYEEAEKANDDRKTIEQCLYKILRLIDYGDRGATTVLEQIQELVNDELARTNTQRVD